MKLIIAFSIMVFVTTTSFGQAIKGIIKDTLNNAIPDCSVYIKDHGVIVSYAISDNAGRFDFDLIKNLDTAFVIEVNSIGFEKQSMHLARPNGLYNFVLHTSHRQLQTITVKDSRPRIRSHGDTLSYKASDFSNPQDRVIGDVIKKIPGIDVTKDGKIAYMGRPISNFYIEGDNLLDDKYNIATNTIPNGIVDQIQILENNQPIKMLQNKVYSDNVALNITIKDKAKLNVIGQETVGAGLPGNYYADLNAMLFNKKIKAINYLKANNTSQDVQLDVISHNLQSYLESINNPKPGAILSLGTVQNPDIPSERYLINHSAIGNFNDLVNLTNGLQVKTNVYYLRNDQTQQYQSTTRIFLPNDTISYFQTQNNSLKPNVLHGQITLLKNTDSVYFKDNLLFEYAGNDGFSNLNANGSFTQQSLYDNIYDFSNEFNLLTTLRSKNILEVYSFTNSYWEPENRIITPGINPELFNNNVAYNTLRQTVSVPSFSQNLYVSYKLSKSIITQSYKAGVFFESQTLHSALTTQQGNGSETMPFDSTTNDLHWRRQKIYTESAYDYSGTLFKANITVPIVYQIFNYAEQTYQTASNETRLFVTPKLQLKYQVGSESHITFNYNYRQEYGTIEDAYRGYILTDYRSLVANNTTLNERKINDATLSFNYRKAVQLFFFSVILNYSHTQTNNITYDDITDNFEQKITLPYSNGTDQYSMSARFSKYLFSLHSSIGVGTAFQLTQTNQIENKILLPYNTMSPSAYFSTETKITNNCNFGYKATFNYVAGDSKIESTNTTIKQFQQQFTITYSPLSNLLFTGSSDYRNSIQTNIPEFNYNFIDGVIRYKLTRSHIDIELDGNNLLNIKKYSMVSLISNTFQSSVYALPGRIVLLKISFNL